MVVMWENIYMVVVIVVVLFFMMYKFLRSLYKLLFGLWLLFVVGNFMYIIFVCFKCFMEWV